MTALADNLELHINDYGPQNEQDQERFTSRFLQYGGGLSAILVPVNLSVAVAGQSDGQVPAQFVVSLGHR